MKRLSSFLAEHFATETFHSYSSVLCQFPSAAELRNKAGLGELRDVLLHSGVLGHLFIHSLVLGKSSSNGVVESGKDLLDLLHSNRSPSHHAC